MVTQAPSTWASAQAQWRSNARLRVATLLAAALLCLSLLFAWSDRIDMRVAQASELRGAIERNKPLGRDKAWVARADESGKQLGLVRSLLWREPELGLAEAALQDELRQLAARTGVAVREMNVARVVDRVKPVTDATTGSLAAAGARYAEVRARMVCEFRRDRVAALLSELAQGSRAMVVERLLIRTASQPPVAELDVRIVVDMRGAS